MMADAELSLRYLLDEIAEEHGYDKHDLKVQPISTGGANYTSALFISTISAPNKENLDLFAKVAIIGESMRSKVPIGRLYDTERFFYQNLAQVYEKIEIEHNIPEKHRLITPQNYGCSDKYLEETIVLENLSAKGYNLYNRFKSVDWEYASKSIEELAKLHALSITYSEENPEEFEKAVKTIKFDMVEESDDEQMKATWEGMLGSAMNVVKEENKERVLEFVKNEMSPETFKKNLAAKRRTVLCHGDFRPSNLMHMKDDNGELHIKIVDYQTMQGSCPIADLMYFIFNGSDEEFRREHYDDLLEHYYVNLSEALKRFNINPDKVYSREDYEYELKEMSSYGLTIGLFTLQIVTVEAANAPSFEGDMTDFIIKPSDVYAERLNGIVNDYIKWGVI